MNTKNFFMLMIIVILAVFFVEGCSDSGNDPTNETGTVLLKLTDAPFPIDLAARAEVTIDQITVKSQGDTNGDSLIVLSSVTATYNLLELRNGVTETLTEVDIPAGIYNQIRLHVVEAEIELTDGQIFVLNIPSGLQTGIKINIHPFLQIAGGTTNEILLDFDLEKSFVMRGNRNNINGFNFKPVIRAVNNSDAATIFGNVKNTSESVLAGARVWIEADSVVSSTFCNENGDYTMIGIPADTYSVSATLEGYDTVSVTGVLLNAGDRVDKNFILNQL